MKEALQLRRADAVQAPRRPPPPRLARALPGAGQHQFATVRPRCLGAEKHDRAKRRWLKLHLGVDVSTGEVAAHVLTDGNAGDAAQVPALPAYSGDPERPIRSIVNT